MQTVNMSTGSLAHHLEVAASHYDTTAASVKDMDGGRLSQQFERQAAECRQWAEALRSVCMVGFGAGDSLEITHD